MNKGQNKGGIIILWELIRQALMEDADQIAIKPEYRELLFWLICVYMDEHKKKTASSPTARAADDLPADKKQPPAES